MNLSKVLKLANGDDSITLKAEENPTHLTIIFENIGCSKKTQFNLNLLTLESENLGIPETTYTSEITMNSTEFSKLCKELNILSESVTITTTMEFVKFAVEGDVGNGSIRINTTTGETEVHEEEETNQLVKQSFALKYLNMFTKATNLSNEVRLQMAQDTPIVVEYQIPELGTLFYYLAPKISDTEEE